VEDQEQAVVDEVDEQVQEQQPAAETDDARIEADLDAILQEYDDEVQVAESKPEQAVDTNNDQIARLDALERQLNAREHDSAMTDAIGKIRGEVNSDFADDALVEGWLNAQAKGDPRLAKAWQERDANPRRFNQVIDKLGQEFSKKFKSLPDAKATNDREIVAAAVKGASKSAPETSEVDEKAVAKMNPAQFDAWVKSVAAGKPT
jgi:hypothetical protein